LQDASSIAQQQHKCREKASENGHTIPPDLEFSDEAVSGTKRNREGLDALFRAAREGRFQVLYLESLSRLARESVLTMPMLKELVYVYGIRIISVSEAIDSYSGNWELLASFMSWHHEQFLKTLRSAVLRGQEGALLANFSVGDWCFGYASEPVSGSEAGRKGRHVKPRMRYIINPEEARWVVQIFAWFVREKRSMQWIARELTRSGVPKDHRSSRPGWHHAYVRRLLTNRKYVGLWPWGQKTNCRIPSTGQLYQEDRSPEETAKWLRERPDLRIVDDDLFFQAQGMLADLEAKCAANRRHDGRLCGTTADAGIAHPRHLLQGLLHCEQCGGTFQIGGADGKYLCCRNYIMGLCSCKTLVPRDRAERMILSAISARITQQPAWQQEVLNEVEAAWRREQEQIPASLRDVERALAAVEDKIACLVSQTEQVRADPDVVQRLRQRRSEKEQLLRQQEQLQQTIVHALPAPTAEWVVDQLRSLHTVLSEGGPAAAHALQQLVGGRIMVEEVREPGRKRHFLRGKFTITMSALVDSVRGQPADSSSVSQAQVLEEIVLDFRETKSYAKLANPVKALFDAGVSFDDMAVQLNCHRNQVKMALAYWHEQHGLPIPDGRSCRQRLAKPTLPEQLAEPAKELWDQNLQMHEIAQRLNCNRDTVTAAIAHWFRSRGLEVPDGRARRKALRVMQSDPLHFKTGDGRD
jgi:hypothetical protein